MLYSAAIIHTENKIMKVKLVLAGIFLLLACAIVMCVLRLRVGKGRDRAASAVEPAAAAEEALPPEEEEPAIGQQEESAGEVPPAAPAVTAAAVPPAGEEEEILPDAGRSAENPDYKGGNGTVLSYVSSDWVRKIIRTCEMEVTVGSMPSDQWRIVYAGMEKETAVVTLQDGDRISLLQQCTLEYLTEPGGEYGGVKGDLWYKVRLADGTDGWVCTNDEYLYGTTPYFGNSYEVLGTLSAGGGKRTARRMSQTLSARDDLSIRDKPWSGGRVIYTVRPGKNAPARADVQVTAITEEEDTLGGVTDRWVKVRYGSYEGWVFGAFLSAERGGPKYQIPESLIRMDFGEL